MGRQVGVRVSFDIENGNGDDDLRIRIVLISGYGGFYGDCAVNAVYEDDVEDNDDGGEDSGMMMRRKRRRMMTMMVTTVVMIKVIRMISIIVIIILFKLTMVIMTVVMNDYSDGFSSYNDKVMIRVLYFKLP